MPSIKQQLGSLPTPVSYSALIDWLTLTVRPTHDPVRLFADKGYLIREKTEDEVYTKKMQGFLPENKFKVVFHEPEYDKDHKRIIRPGVYDALYRQVFRQPSLLPWVSKDDIPKEKWEVGEATNSRRFGNSVLLDFEAGYYDGEAIFTNIEDFSAPEKSNDLRDYEDCLCLGDGRDPYYSTLIILSGGALRDVDYLKVIRDFGRDANATRIDVTLDLQYMFYEDLYEVQGVLAKACGIVEKDGIVRQVLDKSLLTGGSQNMKSPVKKASMASSNGSTLYIGSRQSPFFVRIYDKTAEVKSKYGDEAVKKMPPTLRFEIECKADLAFSVYNYILEHTDLAENELAEVIWNVVMAAYLTIDGKPVPEIINAGDGSSEPAPLVLSTFDTTSNRLSYTLGQQYGPKMRATISGLSDADKVAYLLSCFGLAGVIPIDKAKGEAFLADLQKSLSHVTGIVDKIDEYDLEHRK